MKLQDIYPILNETDEIEIRSCWENKKLFASYENKNDISIKYAGKSGEKPGAYCSITFHVTDCYEGCHTCKNVGTKENRLCYGCNKTGG